MEINKSNKNGQLKYLLTNNSVGGTYCKKLPPNRQQIFLEICQELNQLTKKQLLIVQAGVIVVQKSIYS